MMSSTHPRISRAVFEQEAPTIVAALRLLRHAVERSELDRSLTELVKLHASQLNGCAFCLQYHLDEARRLGLAQAKIDLLAAWREADVFSDRERAALAWTEALTLMFEGPIADSQYADLRSEFSASEVVHLTSAVGEINAWNRIAGALKFSPSSSVGQPCDGGRS